ncbi:hypothetical protein [Nocardioides sp. 503]|nr:hypothetical protein [Nocardioides sp. 503]
MRTASPPGPTWRTLTAAQKQRRLQALRRAQRHQLELDVRMLSALR